MPKTVVEGPGPDLSPDPPAEPEVPLDLQPTPVAVLHQRPTVVVDPVQMLGAPGFLGTRSEIEGELDLIAAAIRIFHRKQPDQVMRECAAYSARLTELTVLLHRVESLDRQYVRVRTQQVDKYLQELDRQFKISSRLVEVMRQDLDLMKG